jgi:DNA helicase-2/ATP-dependent DNA helicase PcrA
MRTDGVMELNEGQRSAVYADGARPIRVVAGAGTGKTLVLVERYLRFVRDGIPPARILALTFTLKAADEMRRRVFEAVAAEHPGLVRELYAAWIMNFHSFGYRLILENAPSLGIDPGVEVASGAELHRIDRALEARFADGRITGVPPDFDFGGVMPAPTRLPALFKMYLGVVKKCRGDMIPIERLLDACTPEDHDSYVAHVRAITALYDAYVDELARRNLIDFDDMIARATRAIAENEQLCETYRRKFDLILVDEFQDTSSAQYDLLRALSGGDFRKVTVVGDEKQSIYRWRDAHVENIREFPGHDVPLKQNYRSRQNILDLAHAFICRDPYYARQAGRIELRAHRPDPANPIVVFHPEAGAAPAQRNEAEAETLAAWVGHLTGGPGLPGVPELVGGRTGGKPLDYGDIAVLLRAVREAKVLPAIERSFRSAGIPYTVVGGADAGGSRGLELLASFLGMLLPGDRRVDLLHVLESPPFAIGHASLEELFGGEGREPADAALLLSDGRIERVQDPDVRDRLYELRALLAELRVGLASRDFPAFLLGALEDTPFFHRLFADGATFREVDELVGELLDICAARDRRGDLELWTFLEHLRAALDDRSFGKDEELSLAPGCVRIMTIHQAKGLEFPAVAVAGIKRPRGESAGFYLSKEKGLFSDTWKQFKRGYDRIPERKLEIEMKKQEERCLLYVAMTRARDFLFVGSPYAGGVEKRGESLFADIADLVAGGAFDAYVSRRSVETVPAVAAAGRDDTAVPAESEDSLLEWRRVRAVVSEEENEPAVPAKPLHFVNWSRLRTFARCPLRYRYRYVLGLGDVLGGTDAQTEDIASERGDDLGATRIPGGISPVGYGILVHELLRELMDGISKGGMPRDGWIEKNARRLGVPSKRLEGVAAGAGRVVQAFLADELATPGKDIRLEQTFQVRLERVVCHGIFDRVERTKGGWRVVDYKVGRRHEDHLFQVAFYMWALGEITREGGVAGRLLYLKESGAAAQDVAPADTRIDSYPKALEDSLATGRFEASPGEACLDCPYRVVCDQSAG